MQLLKKKNKVIEKSDRTGISQYCLFNIVFCKNVFLNAHTYVQYMLVII